MIATTDLSGSDFNDSLADDERPTLILQPLAAYADRITLVRGVSNPGQGDHTPAVRSMFTGEALSGEQDEGSTPSLDTLVSEVLTNDTHAAPILRTGAYGNRVSYGRHARPEVARTTASSNRRGSPPVTRDKCSTRWVARSAVNLSQATPQRPPTRSLGDLGSRQITRRGRALCCGLGGGSAWTPMSKRSRASNAWRPRCAPRCKHRRRRTHADPEDGSYADAERDIREFADHRAVRARSGGDVTRAQLRRRRRSNGVRR